MPKYMDHHKMPPLPPEAIAQAKTQIQAGKPNQFGAKGINVYFEKNGDAYCVSEAPNADAVLKSHEAMGIKVSKTDIHEVTSVV